MTIGEPTLIDEATTEALKQLRYLTESASENLLLKKLPKDYRRGVDVYSMSAMLKVMANAMCLFKNAHGIYPDIVKPKGFNQKIFYRKFFEPLLAGKVGNKLSTAFFIPENLRTQLHCPKVVWRSSTPVLPNNHVLAAGYYYLKANHGSNCYRQIQYPLTDHDKQLLEAECQDWLKLSYGTSSGEWWYNVFKKEVFIEEDVSPNSTSYSFNFFVAHGRVVYICMHSKQTDEELYFDGEFKPIHDNANKDRFMGIVNAFKTETLANLKAYAAQIGAQFSFVRVDFFIGLAEEIYLAELTLSPGNGLPQRPAGFDEHLGELWHLDA